MQALSQHAFWQFSLELYSHQEVQALLLTLQDEANLNVNLALFCAYLDKHSLYLSPTQLDELRMAINEFNARFTNQLRLLRKNIKNNADNFTQYQELRRHLLDAELLLEQQEQIILINATKQFQLSSSSTTSNLQLYQSYISQQNKGNVAALQKLSDLNQYIL